MKWLVGSGLAVVVVAVVVGVLLVSRDTGPPSVASGPGVFRVHVQFLPNGGVRAPDELTYRGTTFRVAFGGTSGSGDRAAAHLTVTGPRGTLKPTATYRPGQRIDLDGAGLKVRTVYAAGSDRDDVVDLQVIPATG